MVRTTTALVLAAAVSESLGAQTPRVSAPITGIGYEITADSAAVGRRQLGVAMSFRVASNAPVILSLPAWSPGHYTLLWFARRVSNFSAQSGETPLDWHKVDFQTRTRVIPLPNAPAKASRIRHGILTGSPPSSTPAR